MKHILSVVNSRPFFFMELGSNDHELTCQANAISNVRHIAMPMVKMNALILYDINSFEIHSFNSLVKIMTIIEN
jgi:hypothetical protein